MKLILKLILGIILGITIGFIGPEFLIRSLLTFQSLAGQLIKFTIPLIILCYIASGIASLPKGSNTLLGKTVGLSYVLTILAGIFAFLIAALILPMLVADNAIDHINDVKKLEGYIHLSVKPIFDVMTALTLAFILGIGISSSNAKTLKVVLIESRDIVDLLLSKVIIPILPFYIAGVFAEMSLDGSVFNTLKTFGVVLFLSILMQWCWITILYIVTGITLKKPPLLLLKNMLPAYFTALGTMSSAATIPVSLQATKANEVDENIANFTVPLCASIHLSGSTITLITCSVSVMLLSPELAIPSLAVMVGFIFMLGITMIAAPGAPGGAVMSALGLLASMLGFSEGALALMIALYLAQDSFGTACNVTGDGAIALLINKTKQ